MLPHYSIIPVAATNQEPVYLNLFETTFILPTILQSKGHDPFLMLQQATNIDLNLTPDLPTVSQRYKYSTRVFTGAGPDQTHIEFGVNFNVNVNDQGAMETYNIVKDWYDLGWNSQNGTLHYKRSCIGTVICNQHDKEGMVLRRVTFNNVQCLGVDGISLDWSKNAEIWGPVGCRFVADFWTDEVITPTFTITPPLMEGY